MESRYGDISKLVIPPNNYPAYYFVGVRFNLSRKPGRELMQGVIELKKEDDEVFCNNILFRTSDLGVLYAPYRKHIFLDPGEYSLSVAYRFSNSDEDFKLTKAFLLK